MVRLRRGLVGIIIFLTLAYLSSWHTRIKISANKAAEKADSSCPLTTVITFKKVGRLGNQLSSYINMLVLERSFQVSAYMPANLRKHLKAFFSNVTMPSYESLEHCQLENIHKIKIFSEFSNKNAQCYNKVLKRTPML